MHGQTISMAQLQYEYSASMLDHLCEQVRLPTRLQTAVVRRRIEFLSGRLCAQRALHASGFGGLADIAIDPDGAPVWPAGYVGSISHCEGFAVAVAGPVQQVAGIGIDVEPLMSGEVAVEICRQCASEQEMAMPRRGDMSIEAWLTVLFSGKESLFKALHPEIRRYFDFLDVSATELDADNRCFTLTLRVALSRNHPAGRSYRIHFQREADMVLTRCQLPGAAWTGTRLPQPARNP
jgi:enterobactin synthetase component D